MTGNSEPSFVCVLYSPSKPYLCRIVSAFGRFCHFRAKYDPGLPGLGTESPELAGDCQGLGTQSPVLGWGWHCSHQQANADSVASLALCVAWMTTSMVFLLAGR